MRSASVTLSQKLVLKLRKKAVETGYLPEVLGVEFMLKCVNEESVQSV